MADGPNPTRADGPNASVLTGLPPPMPTDGELALAWRKWRQRFTIYLKATRQADDSTPPDVKTSLLLHAIGSEGLEVYDSFAFEEEGDKEKYDIVLQKFEDYYMPKANVTCERYKFFTRSQEEGESIDHYATALRTLARTCDFRDIRDSLIRDRIVLGVGNPRLTRRLLAADDPNLTKTLEICRAEEISAAQRRRMAADAPAVSNIDAVHSEMTDWEDDSVGTQLAAIRQGKPGGGQGDAKTSCTRCGKIHQPRKCPAWGKKCGKCHGPNHFAAMCKTKRISVLRATERTESPDGGSSPLYSLGMITAEQEVPSAWKIPITINGMTISFKVDTGAEVSILPRSIYNRLQRRPKLHASAARLLPYGSQIPLPVDGQCVCQVTLESGLHRYLRFVVVSCHDEPLLGLSACEHLGLLNRVAPLCIDTETSEPILEGGAIPDTKIFSDPVASQYRDVFEGLGFLRLVRVWRQALSSGG